MQEIQKSYTIPAASPARELLARLILQEALETVQALGFHPGSLEDRENFVLKQTKEFDELDIYEIIDGCCDTAYVAVGCMVAMGVPDSPHLDEVCMCNDAKFPNGEAIINEKGKYQKPEGWKPPDHKKVYEERCIPYNGSEDKWFQLLGEVLAKKGVCGG